MGNGHVKSLVSSANGSMGNVTAFKTASEVIADEMKAMGTMSYERAASILQIYENSFNVVKKHFPAAECGVDILWCQVYLTLSPRIDSAVDRIVSFLTARYLCSHSCSCLFTIYIGVSLRRASPLFTLLTAFTPTVITVRYPLTFQRQNVELSTG